MCHVCDAKFNYASANFDESLAAYRKECLDGEARDTPAKRVVDLANSFAETPATMNFAIWFTAVAFERLIAMEQMGLVT